MPSLLDLAVVILFVLAGRRTHDSALVSLGTLHALWPFVASLVLAWALTRLLDLPLRGLRAGVLVWLVTLVPGMVLRALTGQGTAVPFLVVATITLAVGLLGWRVVVLLVERRTRA